MHLQLKNIGQINNADIRFGDLTVFVGPQATGKSIALQFLKLVLDMGYVQEEMTRYGLDWSGRLADFLDIYLGEGMRAVWRGGESELRWQGEKIDLMKRRLVLRDGGQILPYMVWSAGQREFVPLLLGLYWLMPPTKVARRREIEWVVLEKLEMGLHARAIEGLILMTLDLVARGILV
jgi:hypothetical protein